MKTQFTFLLFIFSIGLINSQSAICFNYDNAGNRVYRYLCWQSIPATSDENTKLKDSFRAVKSGNSGKIDSREDEKNFKISDVSSLIVFPNPTKGIFHIKKKNISSDADIYIYNNTGNLILHRKYGDGVFDISNFKTGLYLLLLNDNGNLSSARIIRIK